MHQIFLAAHPNFQNRDDRLAPTCGAQFIMCRGSDCGWPELRRDPMCHTMGKVLPNWDPGPNPSILVQSLSCKRKRFRNLRWSVYT